MCRKRPLKEVNQSSKHVGACCTWALAIWRCLFSFSTYLLLCFRLPIQYSFFFNLVWRLLCQGIHLSLLFLHNVLFFLAYFLRLYLQSLPSPLSLFPVCTVIFLWRMAYDLLSVTYLHPRPSFSFLLLPRSSPSPFTNLTLVCWFYSSFCRSDFTVCCMLDSTFTGFSISLPSLPSFAFPISIFFCLSLSSMSNLNANKFNGKQTNMCPFYANTEDEKHFLMDFSQCDDRKKNQITTGFAFSFFLSFVYDAQEVVT